MQRVADDPGSGVSQKWAAEHLKQHPLKVKEKEGPWVDVTPANDYLWYLYVAERKHQLPEDWCSERFDTRGWYTTTFPNVWPIFHWAVLRTDFLLDSPKQYEELRIVTRFEFCEDTAIYINGTKVVRCEDGKSAPSTLALSEKFMKCLRSGRNQIVVIAYNQGRWNGISMHPFFVRLEEIPRQP